METRHWKWPKEQVSQSRAAVVCGLVCVRGEKVPRLMIRVSRSQEKAVTCSSCYSHWICGALSAGLAFEIAFPDATASPQRPGWRCAESWPPSFVSSSYFALKDDEKLLENAFNISLAVSFVAWLLCALVQGITYCSPWLFAFPFLSALVLGSATPLPNTHNLLLHTLLSTDEFHNWAALPRNIGSVIGCFAAWNRQVDDLQSQLHVFGHEGGWSCPGLSQTHPDRV